MPHRWRWCCCCFFWYFLFSHDIYIYTVFIYIYIHIYVKPTLYSLQSIRDNSGLLSQLAGLQRVAPAALNQMCGWLDQLQRAIGHSKSQNDGQVTSELFYGMSLFYLFGVFGGFGSKKRAKKEPRPLPMQLRWRSRCGAHGASGPPRNHRR